MRNSRLRGACFDRIKSEADPNKADTSLDYASNDTRSPSSTDAFPSGYAGLVHRPSESLEVSGGLGTTVRILEPNERYYASRSMGHDWVGNPGLAPSRNTGLAVTGGLANLFNRQYYEALSYQRDPYRSGTKLPEPERTFFVDVGWRI